MVISWAKKRGRAPSGPYPTSTGELEELVRSSTVVLEREDHRLLQASDWRRWGRRGGARHAGALRLELVLASGAQAVGPNHRSRPRGREATEVRFSLGRVVVTPGALEAFGYEGCARMLGRHRGRPVLHLRAAAERVVGCCVRGAASPPPRKTCRRRDVRGQPFALCDPRWRPVAGSVWVVPGRVICFGTCRNCGEWLSVRDLNDRRGGGRHGAPTGICPGCP